MFREEEMRAGIPWMRIQSRLAECVPDAIADRKDFAFKLMPRALDETFGKGRWAKEKRPKKTGLGDATWVVLNS